MKLKLLLLFNINCLIDRYHCIIFGNNLELIMFIEVGMPNFSFNVYSPLLKEAFLHTRLSTNPCPPKITVSL